MKLSKDVFCKAVDAVAEQGKRDITLYVSVDALTEAAPDESLVYMALIAVLFELYHEENDVLSKWIEAQCEGGTPKIEVSRPGRLTAYIRSTEELYQYIHGGKRV